VGGWGVDWCCGGGVVGGGGGGGGVGVGGGVVWGGGVGVRLGVVGGGGGGGWGGGGWVGPCAKLARDRNRASSFAIEGDRRVRAVAMMHIIGCLDVPDRGHYRPRGADCERDDRGRVGRRRNGASASCSKRSICCRRLTAGATSSCRTSVLGRTGASAGARAWDALEQVGLGGPVNIAGASCPWPAATRRGGRCAIVTEARMIIADEPTRQLDRIGRRGAPAPHDLHAAGDTIVLINTSTPSRAPRVGIGELLDGG